MVADTMGFTSCNLFSQTVKPICFRRSSDFLFGTRQNGNDVISVPVITPSDTLT